MRTSNQGIQDNLGENQTNRAQAEHTCGTRGNRRGDVAQPRVRSGTERVCEPDKTNPRARAGALREESANKRQGCEAGPHGLRLEEVDDDSEDY